MRLFGVKATLSTFKWDLVYLLAQLTSDDRPGIADLAPPLQAALDHIKTREEATEQAQISVVVSSALVDKRDRKRDKVIVEMGGVARATSQIVYKQIFPKLNPSKTARLAVDEESTEVQRILVEMKKLEADHPLRTAYESSLEESQSNLEKAKAQDDSAELMLISERSNVQRCKLDTDKARLEAHSKLVLLLGDRSEADSFFRPTEDAPGETKDAPAENHDAKPEASPPKTT